MMRTIKLMFDERDFEKLKRVKEKEQEKSEERISWERFIYKKVLV